MQRIALAGAAIALAIGGAALTGQEAQAQQKFITIGTGGVTGVYYPAGGAICRLVNQNRKETGIRCSAESTGGSIFNLNAIRQGELDFGIVQSDWQYHAMKGDSTFADAGPNADLRSVFSLHPEPLTLVVRADSGIESFEDLKGKRVNIGNPGSGQRATVQVLLEAYGWTTDDFALAAELPSREQGQALCDNNIDAFLFTVGHPSGAIAEPVATCDAQIKPITGEVVDKLVEDTPYYFEATIPAGMYNNSEDVKTFGVGATLVSSTAVEPEVVYQVVKAVFENFDSFKGLHPALQVLTKEDMVSQGNSAPLHEGAKKYYEEAGLLNE